MSTSHQFLDAKDMLRRKIELTIAMIAGISDAFDEVGQSSTAKRLDTAVSGLSEAFEAMNSAWTDDLYQQVSDSEKAFYETVKLALLVVAPAELSRADFLYEEART